MRKEKSNRVTAKDLQEAIKILKANADPNPCTPEEVQKILDIINRHKWLINGKETLGG